MFPAVKPYIVGSTPVNPIMTAKGAITLPPTIKNITTCFSESLAIVNEPLDTYAPG